MPLEILLVLVVGGIAGITLLLHLTGRSQLRNLSPEDAGAEWVRHFPGDSVVDITVTHNRHAALIRTKAGPGLLWSFGADTVAQRMLDFDWLENPQGIEVHFHDFSTPSVFIHLDETERRHWRHLMEPA